MSIESWSRPKSERLKNQLIQHNLGQHWTQSRETYDYPPLPSGVDKQYFDIAVTFAISHITDFFQYQTTVLDAIELLNVSN